GRHRGEDRSQAVGSREERGHRQREGGPQGPVVRAEGAARQLGVQEEGRRLQGAEEGRQPPRPMDQGRVGHQVRPRVQEHRRALPPAQGQGDAVRRGVPPHHRQEAEGHGQGQAVLQPAGGRGEEGGRDAQDGHRRHEAPPGGRGRARAQGRRA
ncbi:MAG: FIG00799921: hypothetical protein, partial [uncultured Acetobacteraceae bacterium]